MSGSLYFSKQIPNIPHLVQGKEVGDLRNDVEVAFQTAQSEIERFMASEGDIVLAVSATGSDTPTNERPEKIRSGDYSSYPFATIQAAIDALPSVLAHPTFINVGAGTFTGFTFENRICLGKAEVGSAKVPYVQIRGATPVEVSGLASGPTSGTATSSDGANRTLTLTGAGWTVNDLRGKFLRVTSGTTDATKLYAIESNTSEVITIVGKGDFSGAVDFQIVTPATVLDELAASEGTRARVRNVTGVLRLQNLKAEASAGDDQANIWDVYDAPTLEIEMRGIEVTSPDFCSVYSRFENLQRVKIDSFIAWFDGSTIGASCSPVFTHVREVEIHDFYTGDGKITGWYVDRLLIQSFAAICPLQGLPAVEAYNSYVELGYECSIYIYDSAYGFRLIRSELHAVYGPSTISINSVKTEAFFMLGSKVNLEAVLSGSANNGYGINASGFDNVVRWEQQPTITASSGDATVDGSTPLDVTTDFASAGDYVEDAGSRCFMLRSNHKMTP